MANDGQWLMTTTETETRKAQCRGGRYVANFCLASFVRRLIQRSRLTIFTLISHQLPYPLVVLLYSKCLSTLRHSLYPMPPVVTPSPIVNDHLKLSFLFRCLQRPHPTLQELNLLSSRTAFSSISLSSCLQ